MKLDDNLLTDFLEFIKIDTQSDGESNSIPSTLKQLDLLKLLKQKLIDLGLDPYIDEYSRLYCELPGNENLDIIGLCSHVDTAGEESGKNIKAIIHQNYDGSNLKLGDSGLVISPSEYPSLKEAINKTIITTSGDTLLGADDKAGVAIIFDAIRNYLKLDINTRHPLRILFTPDEEIGRGANFVNLKRFNADYAFTIDGDNSHVVSIENFNASRVNVIVKGVAIHPGYAYDKLINASKVLIELIDSLPKDLTPENTNNRQGYIHLLKMEGKVAEAKASFLLRNFDKDAMKSHIQLFYSLRDKLNQKYPKAKVEVKVIDEYQNMIEVIKKDNRCVNHLNQIAKKLDYNLFYEPVRGGTDGAIFSFLGCPTPNLGTGSYNHHSKYEYVVLEEMKELSSFILELLKK